jgi:hypothetical protein
MSSERISTKEGDCTATGSTREASRLGSPLKGCVVESLKSRTQPFDSAAMALAFFFSALAARRAALAALVASNSARVVV